MKRLLTAAIALGIALATPTWAFDRAALHSSLEELSQGVSKSVYALNEKEGSAEAAGYDLAAATSEKAERELGTQIGSIENAEDFQTAITEIQAFAKGDKVAAYAAGVATKKLQERAAFLKIADVKIDESLKSATTEAASLDRVNVADAKDLLTRDQERLIMIDTPLAEAVISVDDNKNGRRIDNIQKMFGRHECRVMASFVDESGDKPQTNFYISGKKFVLEAMMRNFKGNEVKNNLQAVMVLTTGGFWGKSSIEVPVTAKAGAPETGTLAWFQAVLEKNPWKYMEENNYNSLSQLGKIEDVGGERKLRLKNAKMELWIIGPNGTKRDAVYFNSVDFGDVYVAAK